MDEKDKMIHNMWMKQASKEEVRKQYIGYNKIMVWILLAVIVLCSIALVQQETHYQDKIDDLAQSCSDDDIEEHIDSDRFVKNPSGGYLDLHYRQSVSKYEAVRRSR